MLGLVLPHCPYIAPKKLFNHYFQCVDVPVIEPNRPATITRFCRVRGDRHAPVGTSNPHRAGGLLRAVRARRFAHRRGARRARRDRAGRKHAGDLHLRPRRDGRRPRMLVEEQLLRRERGRADVSPVVRARSSRGTVSHAVCNLMDLGADVRGDCRSRNARGRGTLALVDDAGATSEGTGLTKPTVSCAIRGVDSCRRG